MAGGSVKKTQQIYENVTNYPLITSPPDKLIIETLAVLELHVLLGKFPFGPSSFRALTIVGPGGLRAAPVVADGSEAGHRFHLFLFSSYFFFWSRRFACTTRGAGGRQKRS